MSPDLVGSPRRRTHWVSTLTSTARLLVLLLIVWVWETDSVSAQALRAPLALDVPSVDELARRALDRERLRPTRHNLGDDRLVRSPAQPLTPLSPESEDSPRFRDALIGSTVGVGVSVGTLFLLSGSDLSDRYDRGQYADNERMRARGAALLLVVGSAPIGAVLGAGLADNGLPGEALLAAGLGEFIAGGMGVLVGIGGTALMGGGSQAQRVGAGVGAGVGAAVGAALGAMLSAREGHGALSFRQGTWSFGVPDITLHPTFRHDQPIAAHMPLVTASL